MADHSTSITTSPAERSASVSSTTDGRITSPVLVSR